MIMEVMAKGQFPARYSLSLSLSSLSDCDLIFLSLSPGWTSFPRSAFIQSFLRGGTVLTETPVCTDSQR